MKRRNTCLPIRYILVVYLSTSDFSPEPKKYFEVETLETTIHSNTDTKIIISIKIVTSLHIPVSSYLITQCPKCDITLLFHGEAILSHLTNIFLCFPSTIPSSPKLLK